MTNIKYNFDGTMTLKNKITGNKFINNVSDKKIYYIKAQTGKKSLLADFCFTDLIWNDSSKDIDNITLDGVGGKTDYTIGSNSTALKNRIFKESNIGTGAILPSTTDKKFQHFAVNDLLYQMILVMVYRIQDETLPTDKEGVTLSISTEDSAGFTNGTVIVTAKDESSTEIEGLNISGLIGDDIEITGITDNNGKVETSVSTEGTFDISVESEETEVYKSATKTGSVTVTAKESVEVTG